MSMRMSMRKRRIKIASMFCILFVFKICQSKFIRMCKRFSIVQEQKLFAIRI
jgi:hypothetical protein